jgi:hypothetical protein
MNTNTTALSIWERCGKLDELDFQCLQLVDRSLYGNTTYDRLKVQIYDEIAASADGWDKHATLIELIADRIPQLHVRRIVTVAYLSAVKVDKFATGKLTSDDHDMALAPWTKAITAADEVRASGAVVQMVFLQMSNKWDGTLEELVNLAKDTANTKTAISN